MGKRDVYDPETMVVRDIEELFEDCRKVVNSRLPGTNKFVLAAWAALVEAYGIYNFAHSVITEERQKTLSDPFVWKEHGCHYAAATIIRRIADALGVSNFKTREVPGEPQAVPGDQPVGHVRPGGQDQPG